MTPAVSLHDTPIPVRIRLAGLWASVMFCFIYGDYFELYRPGKLASMEAGRIGPWDVSPGVLIGTTILMLIPSLMTAATLILPVAIARVVNIVFGLAYAAIMVLAIQGAWTFYVLFGLVEIALCAGIVWTALRWPRAATRAGSPA